MLKNHFNKILITSEIIFFLLSVSSASLFSQKSSWELRKNENGIKVYTRKADNTNTIEFKALTEIDVNVEKMVSILKDADSYPKWMTDLKYAKKIKVIDENNWYAYYIAEVPWPLEDRDVIYLLQIFKQDENTVISLESKPKLLPLSDDHVRINIAEGKWIFTPINENKTQVYYQFYADPEINVPLWIMNMFIVDGPYQTLENLRKFSAEKNK